jgi:hypothetical protein
MQTFIGGIAGLVTAIVFFSVYVYKLASVPLTIVILAAVAMMVAEFVIEIREERASGN